MRVGAVSPLLQEINAAFPKANDDPFARLILKDETPVGRIEVDEGVSGTLYLSSIRIEESYRRRGIGQEALGFLSDLADRHGCKIWLKAFYHPRREGGGHLIGWYEQNGFEVMSEPDDDQHVEMRRLPRPEPSPEP